MGGEHRTDAVSPLVAEHISSVLGAADAERAKALLAQTSLPFLDDSAAGRQRVHLAIIHLAAGDLAALERWAAEAARDWRDVLVVAGLADRDWRDVLRARGVAV